MSSKLKKFTPFLIAGAFAGAIAVAPVASANPGPCINPDGTACTVVGPDGSAGPGGATGAIPGGPGGTAGPGGASGYIPGGPSGSAGPGGVSGCIPGVGCLNP